MISLLWSIVYILVPKFYNFYSRFDAKSSKNVLILKYQFKFLKLYKFQSCPVMSGGPRYEYRWQDSSNEKYKKPTNVTAGTYVHELMAWIENIVNDENIFPVKVGKLLFICTTYKNTFYFESVLEDF